MLQFNCSCGKLLRAREELAGKRIKCPHCEAVQVVPVAEEEDDEAPARPAASAAAVIRFACDCGKQMTAKSALAGKRTKCPGCGEILTIPEAEDSETAAAITAKPKKAGIQAGKPSRKPVVEGDPFEDEDEPPRKKGKKQKDEEEPEEEDREEDEEEEETPRRRKKKPAKQKSSMVLWISIIGGALLLVGGVTAFLWPGFLLSKEGPDNKPPDKRGPGPQARAGGAGDLDLIPGDALGFVSIRLADVWNSEPGKQMQKVLASQPGGNIVALMERQLGVNPGDMERVTFVFPSTDTKMSWGVFACTKPVDRKKILEGDLKGAQTVSVQGKEYYATANAALYFVDEKTLMMGAPNGIRNFLETSAGRKASGPMSEFVKLASSGNHHIFAAGSVPPQVMQGLKANLKNLPGSEMFAPLLEMQSATLTADLGAEIKVDVSIKFPDEPKAQGALETIRAAIALAKVLLPKQKKLFANTPNAQLVDLGEKLLIKVKVEQQGAEVKISLADKVDLGKIVPDKVPDKGISQNPVTRITSQNNLKLLAIAMISYADTYGGVLPPAEWHPGLSWRVAILPYVEQGDLYKQFHLDEPWDSPHNKTLLGKMPVAFQHPNESAQTNAWKTHYQVFAGMGAPFNGNQAVKFPGAFVDGTSNTLLVVEAEQPVEWTKPEDIAYSPTGQIPPLGGLYEGGFCAVMADGTARFIKKTVSLQTLRALITPAGGEQIGKDWE